MPPVSPLPASRLHAIMDPARIPWEDSSRIPRPRNGAGSRSAFQPRFLQAMDLALAIQTPGYNIYVSGESNLGRTYTLLAYLEPQARKAPLPPDLVYVNNFADPDSPILLSLQNIRQKACANGFRLSGNDPKQHILNFLRMQIVHLPLPIGYGFLMIIPDGKS